MQNALLLNEAVRAHFGEASDTSEETHLCFYLSPSVFRSSRSPSSRRYGSFSSFFYTRAHKPVDVLAKPSLQSLPAKESWEHCF